MTDQHRYEYLVRALPITTQDQRVAAAAHLQQMLTDGWLPASGFTALGTMPKDHTTWLLIMARERA